MKLFIVVVIGVTLAQVFGAPSSAKVSSSLLNILDKDVTADIVLNLRQRTSQALQAIKHQSFATRGARITAVASSLQALAASSQKSVLAYLETQPNKVTSLWISNQISVRDANLQLVNVLATMPEIESIFENKLNGDALPKPSGEPQPNLETLQWGVEMVEAPAAWEQGFTGNGVIVGILDSGVRYTHELLFSSYRQERGWFDAYEGSPIPIDGFGHGTHVMGSILGADGICVAPDATWIACRASGGNDFASWTICSQFLLCPTHADGTEPDCNAAPHVVSNSWGFPYNQEWDFMDSHIDAFNTAGIFVVFSNGNSGSSCSTAGYPANSDNQVFTVGATDSNDNLATFSSRGPGLFSGAGLIKPDIAAPGVNVISCNPFDDTTLVSMSGTSMAAPHVAGVIALLLTNGTELTHSELSSFLYEGASHNVPPTGGNCGGIPETEYPNNAVGHGRISAAGAIARLLASRK